MIAGLIRWMEMSESLSAIYLSFNEKHKSITRNQAVAFLSVIWPNYSRPKWYLFALKAEQIRPKLMCTRVCLCTQDFAWEEGGRTTRYLPV